MRMRRLCPSHTHPSNGPAHAWAGELTLVHGSPTLPMLADPTAYHAVT